jgi:anti-sigma regulatory factor (Ser/Thr protein kinase)
MGWGRTAPGYIHVMCSTTTGGSRTAGLEVHGPTGLRMRLGNGPEAAAEARRALSELRADLDPPLMETLRLLVTELVTNSMRHTECDSVTLRVAIGKAAVLTEVADDGPKFDAGAAVDAEQPGARDENTGWGLFLVQRLARDWGVKEEGRSKRVWFELARA